MSNATYGGLNIFGNSVRMTAEIAPRETQVNHYFGLSGNEILDGGGNGGKVQVSGVFVAPDLPTLRSYWNTFQSYQDNVQRVLIDTSGRSFPVTRLTSFTETGPILRNTYGKAWRWYKAEFTVDQ